MSARHFELIFGLLTIPKSDLFDFEKGMFHGLAWHFKLIFGLWNNLKCDLGEINKATIFLVIATNCD